MPRPRLEPDEILGAIDVGTNAVRLELARRLPDGSLETLHQERDPVRPGEGLFKTGVIQKEVADRLMSALRRYAALCRRHQARVRAVATSALREAKNREEIVRRAKREAHLTLEVVSGREEARLICSGVLRGVAPTRKSVCIDLGGGSTEVIYAEGEHPQSLWSLEIGAVRLTELFDVKDKVSNKQLKLLRNYARELMSESLPRRIVGAPRGAVGSSGTVQAVVGFARSEGVGHATTKQISKAVEDLAEMDTEKRRKRFDPRRADIVVAGAVILEAVLKHLKLARVSAVDRGLREGILNDLARRKKVDAGDQSLFDAALAYGQRFAFGEPHGRQVTRLALKLFDDLASLHQLPAAARPLLETASLLHDVGHAINYQKHHRHSHYLILNADLPGLTDHERELVAAIARFHRRGKPDADHELFATWSDAEVRLVRKCTMLLRLADSLDRSHQQPVRSVVAQERGRTVHVRVHARHSLDLELWDVEREAPLFREIFGRGLSVTARY